MKRYKTKAVKGAIYGVLFGFCFPIAATYLDIWRLNLDFSLINIIEVQKSNPIHFIIDLAPFFLGLFAFFIGYINDKYIMVNTNLESIVQQKTKDYIDLINSVEGIVWEYDLREDTFTFVSDKAEEISGFPVSKWLEKNFWSNHIHEEDRDFAVNYYREQTRRNLNYVFEYRMITSTSEIIWIRDYCTVISKNGETLKMKGIMIDISEEKKAKSIIVEKESIKKSLKFKEQFLANMSHEIRTPMNGIIGMIDVLQKKTKLNKLQLKYVETIQKSSLDLLHILNDILDLSKLEAGKQELKYEEMKIHDLVHQVQNLFSAKAKEKNITITSLYSDNLINYFKAPKVRLTQVLSNLVNNAVKFTDKGNITIKTLLIEQDEDKLKLKIEVIDTGQGIEKTNQSKLFEPSQQFQQYSTKAKSGTGLGLTICKKFVELMDGEIGVESQIGQGSTFWFTFTAFTAKRKQENKQARKTENTKFGLKVLLVDDVQINIMVVELMLTSLGCQVKIAKNGKEAVEKNTEEDFDLILMDIQMPVMDGVEACKIIKNRNKETPIIIGLSADGMEGSAEKYMNQGLDDYLHKPITLDVLSNKMAQWFKPKSDKIIN